MAGAADGNAADFSVGLRIRLVGLNTRPELNGKLGTLRAPEDGSDGRRWKVQLEDGLGLKLFRAENIAPASAGVAQEGQRPEQPPPAGPRIRAGPGTRLPDSTGASPARPGGAGLPATAEQHVLKPGAQVLVRGSKHSGPTGIDGQIGIVECFKFNLGCWSVRFEDGTREAFRPELLEVQTSTLRPGAAVRLHGLHGAVHLNGRKGVCENLDASGLRWNVRLDDGELKALKPEYVALLAGDGIPLGVDRPADALGGQAQGHSFTKQMEEMLASGEMLWEDY